MYHVPWIALFSAKRWRLDVLTFPIKGFAKYYKVTLAVLKQTTWHGLEKNILSVHVERSLQRLTFFPYALWPDYRNFIQKVWSIFHLKLVRLPYFRKYCSDNYSFLNLEIEGNFKYSKVTVLVSSTFSYEGEF